MKRPKLLSILKPCLSLAAAGLILVLPISTLLAGPRHGQRQSSDQGQDEGQRRAYVEADRLIRLSMEVPVEPERCFDAWADASQLVEWFPHWVEMTVTEGGAYRMGWDGYDAVWEGTFLKVERPALLVFTWRPPATVFPEGSYPTTVKLTFEDLDGTTSMVLEHSGFRGSQEMESTLEAWRAYLYNLRAYLLQQQSQPEPLNGS
ncbi:MAG: SRPBCC domain-containing protein [Acidobacteriota bacterium]